MPIFISKPKVVASPVAQPLETIPQTNLKSALDVIAQHNFASATPLTKETAKAARLAMAKNAEEVSAPRGMLQVGTGFDLKTDINAFVAAITEINTKAIADSFERREIDLAAIAKNIDLLQEEERIVADYGMLLQRRCKKTGKLLDSIEPQTILNWEKVQEPELLRAGLELQFVEYCHSAWLATNPDALQKLSELRPLEYFVYAASKVFSRIGGWEKEPGGLEINQMTRIKDLAALYDHNSLNMMRPNGKVEFGIANELMRRFLSLIHPSRALHVLDFSGLEFATLTPELVIEIIKKNIKLVVQYEYRKGRLRRNISYADALDLKNLYGGFTNFRRQGKPKKLTDTEIAYLSIKHEFMPGLTKARVAIKTMSGQEKLLPSARERHSGKVFTGTKFAGFGNKPADPVAADPAVTDDDSAG